MLLVTFTAGANQYAIDVARVVEVVPRVELRKVPHTPAYLAGLLGYRGKVIPIIDLCLLLDLNPCRDCLSTRIILVNDAPVDGDRSQPDRDNSRGETGRDRVVRKRDLTLIGLVAEHVNDLTYIQPEQEVAVPAWLPQAPYLGGIVQTDQGIVQLIVVEKIREASLQSFYSGRGEALESKSEF